MRGRVLEHVDERVPDDRALLFGILYSCERIEKSSRRIDGHEPDSHVLTERALDLLALVHSQQSGIDEDARQLITDSAMHERCGNRRVHASGQTADYVRVTDFFANARNLGLDERAR